MAAEFDRGIIDELLARAGRVDIDDTDFLRRHFGDCLRVKLNCRAAVEADQQWVRLSRNHPRNPYPSEAARRTVKELAERAADELVAWVADAREHPEYLGVVHVEAVFAAQHLYHRAAASQDLGDLHKQDRLQRRAFDCSDLFERLLVLLSGHQKDMAIAAEFYATYRIGYINSHEADIPQPSEFLAYSPIELDQDVDMGNCAFVVPAVMATIRGAGMLAPLPNFAPLDGPALLKVAHGIDATSGGLNVSRASEKVIEVFSWAYGSTFHEVSPAAVADVLKMGGENAVAILFQGPREGEVDGHVVVLTNYRGVNLVVEAQTGKVELLNSDGSLEGRKLHLGVTHHAEQLLKIDEHQRSIELINRLDSLEHRYSRHAFHYGIGDAPQAVHDAIVRLIAVRPELMVGLQESLETARIVQNAKVAATWLDFSERTNRVLRETEDAHVFHGALIKAADDSYQTIPVGKSILFFGNDKLHVGVATNIDGFDVVFDARDSDRGLRPDQSPARIVHGVWLDDTTHARLRENAHEMIVEAATLSNESPRLVQIAPLISSERTLEIPRPGNDLPALPRRRHQVFDDGLSM